MLDRYGADGPYNSSGSEGETALTSWHQSFNQELLNQAARAYGVAPETVNHVGGFENLIYGFRRDGRDLILRVTHSSHRSRELIESELHFVGYLAEGGVRAAKPVPSYSGRRTETVHAEDGYFTLACFEQAPGGLVQAGHPAWGPRLFEGWGEITGRMHKLARSYTVPADMTRRPDKDILTLDPAYLSHPDIALAHRRYAEVEARINALEPEQGGYGLCHRDLHHKNFFVHGETITAFDFDDCGYDYFVQDIAMAVYYASVLGDWARPEADPKRVSEFANRFLDSFMNGYRREHELGSDWLKQLPLFVERRCCDLCMIFLQNAISEPPSAAVREWLDRNLEEISRGNALLDL